MNPFLPTPDPRRWNRGFLAACLAIPFTVVQIWAVAVVSTSVTFEGAAGVAFLLAIGGSAVAVLAGWRWAWRLGHKANEHRRPALIT